MSGRDLDGLRRRAVERLGRIAAAAVDAPGVEAALAEIARATFELLGDGEAHLRPGALKPGERQFRVSGFFVVTPARDEHVLIAEHGFPPEQHRLRIPVDLGHPGQVVRSGEALLLANTDDDPGFRQILKTSRMGSAMYGPFLREGRVLGQLVTAAQARHTFAPVDLEIHVAFARLAGLAWAAHDGDGFLRALVDAA